MGAYLQAQNNNGRTALHHVGEKGNNDIAQLLLFHGIDRNTTDNDDKTALDLAVRYLWGPSSETSFSVILLHGRQVLNEIIR